MTFLKWVGGKGGLISQLKDYFPDFNNCKGYVECFLGGGSVFFYLKEERLLENKSVYLSDINSELINTYKIVRDNVNELIVELDNHYIKHNENYFNAMKKIYPPGFGMTAIEKAAAYEINALLKENVTEIESYKDNTKQIVIEDAWK